MSTIKPPQGANSTPAASSPTAKPQSPRDHASERDLAADLESVREYSKAYYGEVLESYERLGRYRPDVLVDWINLRRSIFESDKPDGLSLREFELVSTAIEIAAHKPNPDRHARLAIDAGATVRQVADVVSVCILLGGMMTYIVSGQHALRAAEERARELNRS
jgi:alkylhydroperoxidase/carboxymuconolactone decarboxylase family protein YurZ